MKTLRIPNDGFFSKYGDENRNALLRANHDYVIDGESGDFWVVLGLDIDLKACRALVHKEDCEMKLITHTPA